MERIIVAVGLVVVGLALVFVVPTAYEGPMWLYINERHAIRLMDALGLGMMVPSWLYLNLVVLRSWAERRKKG